MSLAGMTADLDTRRNAHHHQTAEPL